jgi:class III poly(R)-hydroxyalkanoic acid synthase PhaE subunit
MAQSNSSDAFGQAWLDAQRRYWETWLDLSRQASAGLAGSGRKASEAATNPFTQGLEQWWQAVSAALPGQQAGSAALPDMGMGAGMDTFEKLYEQGRSYLQMGERLWSGLQQAQDLTRAGEQWGSALRSSLDQVRDGYLKTLGGSSDPWAAFATFWGLPMDNWRRVLSSLSVMPGDAVKALRGEGGPQEAALAALRQPMDQALATPPLGYTREMQEQGRDLAQCWMDYGRVLQEFSAVLGKVGERAFDILHDKLLVMGEKGESPEGLRALYNLWVDCGEEAYAEVAMSGDFARAQAHLSNATMAIKRQEQRMVDEALAGLNMPTRRELDTAHRRQAELRREVKALRRALEDVDLEALQAQVQRLEAGQAAAAAKTSTGASAGASAGASGAGASKAASTARAGATRRRTASSKTSGTTTGEEG